MPDSDDECDVPCLEFDIIHSCEDLLVHPAGLPAYVLVPASMVGPLARLAEVITSPGEVGALARGIELLLVAFSEGEPELARCAVTQVIEGFVAVQKMAIMGATSACEQMVALARVAAQTPSGMDGDGPLETSTITKKGKVQV